MLDQVRNQQHPLLVHVLALERSLECLISDLEYINNHTVVENVTLNRKYADKVAEYRAWWAGWQNRLSVTQRMGDWLLCQLNNIHEWAPPQRVEQYSTSTKIMQERLEQVIRCCERADVFGQTISGRLSAWQDAAFRKAAQEDNRIMMQLADLTLRDGSTMKLLAFLGTIFLPATFVSSFFSMPLFDWEASSESAITRCTILWIKFRIGRRGKWTCNPFITKRSNLETRQSHFERGSGAK
ncbi:hypothetical protein CC78DRAFT_363997 [Lojkania enalia]|uniref:Uncharacterized protein n=1 Tax=Lojkania enalia TaxID=147567 RepID=A0A9P4K511_9PLEO|nr:hypothetical protein CC78DRAFT_363997 [Didymosphaeria enalia]